MGLFDDHDKFPGLSPWAVKDAVQRMKRARDRSERSEILDDFKEMGTLLGPVNELDLANVNAYDISMLDQCDLVLTNQLIADGNITLRDERLKKMSFEEKAMEFLGLDEAQAAALRNMIQKELDCE